MWRHVKGSDLDVREITSCRQRTCIKRHPNKCSPTSIAARDFQKKSHMRRWWNQKIFLKIRKQYQYVIEKRYNTLLKLRMRAKYIFHPNKKVKLSHFCNALHSVPYLRATTSFFYILVFEFLCITSLYYIINQKDATLVVLCLLTTTRVLYMFRTPFVPIIRSTINCNSRHWCLSLVGME